MYSYSIIRPSRLYYELAIYALVRTNLHLEFQMNSEAFKQQETNSKSHGEQAKKVALNKLWRK